MNQAIEYAARAIEFALYSRQKAFLAMLIAAPNGIGD
jgi:hypothetical protein